MPFKRIVNAFFAKMDAYKLLLPIQKSRFTESKVEDIYF